MTILYVNAPQEKAKTEGKRSYEDTLKTAVGDGYAIPKADAQRCFPGCDVVVLCKDKGKQAKGKLKALVPTGEKTGNGILRYDVHIDDLAEVPYSPPPRLRRQGILVID